MAASRLGEAEATAAAGRVPRASRRPLGSTSARAAHALRPPLKGPARIPPGPPAAAATPLSHSYKFSQECPVRSLLLTSLLGR